MHPVCNRCVWYHLAKARREQAVQEVRSYPRAYSLGASLARCGNMHVHTSCMARDAPKLHDTRLPWYTLRIFCWYGVARVIVNASCLSG